MKLKIVLISLLFFIPGLALAADDPVIDSVSSEFLSVTKRTQENATTIAVYGHNFSDLIFDNNINIYLGDFRGQNTTGNNEAVNATFYFYNQDAPDGEYYLTIKDGNNVIYRSTIPIRIFNPYGQGYQKPKLKKFFKKTRKNKASKRMIGLNVHEAQASNSDTDPNYISKLGNSNTKWVREHFSHHLIMGSESDGWVTRYDKVLDQYQDQNIRVIGMLAYNKSDSKAAPSIGAWKKFVRYTVRRYKNHVAVWEIWNEPDSDTYLQPSTMNEYLPILKTGYKITKQYDPDSVVLNGGIADISRLNYINNLYRRGHKYFDALNIHLYYCDEYIFNGNNGAQRVAVESLEDVIFKNNRKKKVWVTEIGCSTAEAGVSETIQRKYLEKSSKYLLNRGYVRHVSLYTMRDRALSDPVEAEFGLMDLDFKNKKAWKYYRKLPKR
ncbi:hypothetical protein KKC88_03000 [Patescibacteria group bacterium]|nr:hypothetical protein [Patescibacteria group bacterium]MBU1673465.1 hypothetical protein [Patescibacteria group bacterium]MBU1962913.1 hypothetical protein [Patescibacteria group bacterium]